MILVTICIASLCFNHLSSNRLYSVQPGEWKGHIRAWNGCSIWKGFWKGDFLIHAFFKFSHSSTFICSHFKIYYKITAENPNQILSKTGRWCNSCLRCHRQSPERTWLEVSHWTILCHHTISSITIFFPFFSKFYDDTSLILMLHYIYDCVI